MPLSAATERCRSIKFLGACLIGLLLIPTLGQASSDRVRLRFDANWRFKRDKDSAPSGMRGPFSWEWKLAGVNQLDQPQLPSDLMGGNWKPTQLGVNTLNGDQDRFAWYRAELGHAPLGAEKVLEFDSVDDNAVVYLNGRKLYRQIGFGIPFKVPVKAAWNAKGPNSLVILVENTAAGGGINGGINLVMPSTAVVPTNLKWHFDDSKWRTVQLPHDYLVEGKFTPTEDVSHGSLPKPTGTYRKTFTPPNSFRGKSVWIDFDGIYRNSSIYLNGEKLGDHSSGYIGARFDISDQLKFGRPNVIAVRVDPRKNEGWWYEGAGIYRHVWLNAANKIHLIPNGIFARCENLTRDSVDLKLTSSVKNYSPFSAKYVVSSQIIDPTGKVVATINAQCTANRTATTIATAGIKFRNPMLWDLNHPNLYKAITTVRQGKRNLDQVTTTFGIRDIKWDKDRGFLLNGQVVKLQGTCNHQDHAGVGIAMPDGLQEWRVKKLLAMGSNAYRTSHNPVSPELLDICDRMGMLVLDETRHLGDSTLPKTPSGTTANDLSELKTLILRDRNHPSVIAWSLYNEEGLQGTDEGAAIFKKMRAVVDDLDGTRISTGANNFGYGAGVELVANVYGFNYSIGGYDDAHRRFPNQALFGSETSSAVSTRGEYANDEVKGYVSAYDLNAPGWGATAEGAWKPIAARPWMAGAFVWTGFDYKGEPTPYGWPCINSHFGIIDIAGFPKDNFYYYKSTWRKDLTVHVLPHWNWPGKEGKPINVWVHSNADAVELYLNGTSLGKKQVPHLGHLEWSVSYAPGTLLAVGTRGANEVMRDQVETTGKPVALRLKTDRKKILDDHEDLTTVAVEVVDAKGRVVPYAANRVAFTVKGAAVLGGVGNGDPSDHDPDQTNRRKAFHGLCMALVQSNGHSGKIQLLATSAGLKSASIDLTTAPTSVPNQ